MNNYRVFKNDGSFYEIQAERIVQIVEQDIGIAELSVKEAVLLNKVPNIAQRIIWFAEMNEIRKLSELARWDAHRILRSRNVGKKTLEYIRKLLNMYGYKLHGE